MLAILNFTLKQKKRSIERFFHGKIPSVKGLRCRCSSTHRFKALIQAALVSCSFILVNKPAARHSIKNRRHLDKKAFCHSSIARFDGMNCLLNIRTHHRTTTCIVRTMLFSLSDAFFCLFSVSQGNSPVETIYKLAGYYIGAGVDVNHHLYVRQGFLVKKSHIWYLREPYSIFR